MNCLLATNRFHGCLIRSGHMLRLVVFIVQYSASLSALLSKPMNTVSVVGNRAIIVCVRNQSDYPVTWEFASVGSNNFSSIYLSQLIPANLSSRYKIDTDNKTRYDVVIESVDLSHAGTYRCTPITEKFVNKSSDSAELVVLVSDPVCNTNASALNDGIVEDDYIQMWCTVDYSGNWIPVMEWTTSSGRTVDADILYVNTSTTVTSSLIIQLDSTDNGVTFTCKTNFKPRSTFNRTMKPGETVATNIPTYQHLWNFTANVFYEPRNLTIIGPPMKSTYEIGDRLTCWANGNPPPDYEWMDIETKRTFSGSVLAIADDMRSDQNQSFKCTAYNTVAGLRKHIAKTVTFTGTAFPAATTPITPITTVLTVAGVIAVIGLIALGLGVALTVKAWTKGNSMNRKTSKESSIQHQDYEMVDESNVQTGNCGNPPLSQNTSNEEGAKDQSAENIECEGYASMKRSSSATFAQPAVYTQLQLYAN